jgi:ABC-type dipeptide/oligopeptide/nickel transport system ATPase subunit
MNNFTIVNKTVGLVAKRNSGKSCLLKHLVESERHKFSKIFVVCPTEKINRFYSEI